jgi:hypothetical protein
LTAHSFPVISFFILVLSERLYGFSLLRLAANLGYDDAAEMSTQTAIVAIRKTVCQGTLKYIQNAARWPSEKGQTLTPR